MCHSDIALRWQLVYTCDLKSQPCAREIKESVRQKFHKKIALGNPWGLYLSTLDRCLPCLEFI